MKQINRKTGNLIMCIAEALIGILLLINPVGFTSGIIITLGVVLAIFGIRSIVQYFRDDPTQAAVESNLVKGLICLLLGLFCVCRSEWFIVTFPILTVIYGVATLVTGISKVQWSVDMLRQKQKYWFVAVIGAVLTLAFAILILCNPFTSTAVLWTFVAISLILEAIIDIVTYILGRK